MLFLVVTFCLTIRPIRMPMTVCNFFLSHNAVVVVNLKWREERLEEARKKQRPYRFGGTTEMLYGFEAIGSVHQKAHYVDYSTILFVTNEIST